MNIHPMLGDVVVGGDIVTILVVIVLILLAVYLAKRL
jgi:hypothetical protein